jgi:hypothetical protein
MTKTQAQLWEKAAGDLADELAKMHGVLFNLIAELRETRPVLAQRVLIEAANFELRRSQQRFFTKYGDMMGGAAPEDN